MRNDNGRRFARRLAAAVVAWPLLTNIAGANCKLSRIAALAVTMVDMQPMVTAKINGNEVSFLADSGAFYSTLSPAAAAQFKLRTYPAPFGFYITGIGGTAAASIGRVEEFTLAGVPLHNIEFLVGGSEVGGGAVGVLGQNVFRLGDVEYDLAQGIIRLMREEGCGKANLAYWTAGTTQAYSVIDIQSTTPQQPHTTGTAMVNGTKIRVMFDTGAATSVMSTKAAERAGVRVDSPGVTYAGYSRGIGQSTVKTYIAPFASFKLGDEEIRNTQLRIGETVVDIADMLIGADFFLSHRVYVAGAEHKLFFTYNGGPVFNLTAAPAPVAAPASPAAVASGSAGETSSPAAASSPDEPKDAAGYSRRGTAFAARREFTRAIADLTRACELAPGEPNYFYERGIARWQDKQPMPALDDFDQAIKLDPTHIPARVARAQWRAAGGDAAGATADLDAADTAAAKEADVRLSMAYAYSHLELWKPAVLQLDAWIDAHRVDVRLPDALVERCRVRGLSGSDPGKGQDDCNAALKLIDRKGSGNIRVLASRALVRLRLGDYDKAIADDDTVLVVRPKDAWVLYGRGIAKLRRGRSADGQSDVDAAVAMAPHVAESYKKIGLVP